MYADQGELSKAIKYLGSRQAVANALGTSRQFIDQCVRSERKVSPQKALKMSQFCGWEADIYKLAPDQKEMFDLMQAYFTHRWHPPKSIDALSVSTLPLHSIILGNGCCPIYPGAQDFSAQKDNPHFHRPLLIDTQHHLISCACRFQAYQQWGYPRVEVIRLSLFDLLKYEVHLEALTPLFPLSERVPLYPALQQVIGLRQGRRTDLSLVQNFGWLPGTKTREVLAKRSGFNNYAHYKQVADILCTAIPVLIQTMDRGAISVSRAQTLAHLPPYEQHQTLENLHLLFTSS